MAKSKLEIFVTAQTDKAVKGFKKLDKSMKDVGKQSKDTGGKMSFMDGVMLSLGGMATNFALGLAKSVPQLVDLGIEADRAQLALEGYAGSSSEAARYTEAVGEAAGGALSKMDAMQNASKLLSMGLAGSTEEAAKLTEMAITLGASMGKGPTQAFEEFTLLLANQSKLRLDTFGISSAEVTKRMAEMKLEVEGLDTQTAFMNATMEIGAEALEKLGAAGFEATNDIDQLKAATTDLKVELGQRLAPVALEVAEEILRVFDEMEVQQSEVYKSVVKSTGSFEEFKKTQLSLSHQFWMSVIPAYEEYIYQNEYLRGSVELGEEAMDGWSAGILDNASALEDGAVALGDYKAELSELEMYIAGKIGPATEKFKEKTEGLQLSILELEQGIARLENQKYLTPEQSQELGAMKQKLGEQKTAVEELAAAHELAMKKILFSMLAQQAESTDEVLFLAEFAEGWGLIDEKTREAFQQAGTAMDLFRAGDTEGARAAIQGMAADLDITTTASNNTETAAGTLNTSFKTLATEGLLNAKKEAELVDKAIRQIPSQKVVDIYVRTIYSSYGTPSGYSTTRQNLPQGYQHGGSFMVGGPSGIDKTPINFMATRGERVDIIPKGGKGGGGTTINLTYAPALSLGNREEMETELIPFLSEAMSRYGLSQ